MRLKDDGGDDEKGGRCVCVCACMRVCKVYCAF